MVTFTCELIFFAQLYDGYVWLDVEMSNNSQLSCKTSGGRCLVLYRTFQLQKELCLPVSVLASVKRHILENISFLAWLISHLHQMSHVLHKHKAEHAVIKPSARTTAGWITVEADNTFYSTLPHKKVSCVCYRLIYFVYVHMYMSIWLFLWFFLHSCWVIHLYLIGSLSCFGTLDDRVLWFAREC